NFAPADLIEIKRALPLSTPAIVSAPVAKEHVEISEPLVTCIMPTHNRRSFVPQAIRCFLRQDYSNLELLVVDDGTEPVGDLLTVNGRVGYGRSVQTLTSAA